jgi:predicted nuclease of predicted toxin-antitoxin system
MLKFVIDEDMPRSTARVLKANNFDALDVRDYGLRGKDDYEIFGFAQENKAILLTGDLGFGNLLHFPLGSHSGIVIAHFPNELSTSELNNQILKAFKNLEENDFQGNLIILEPDKLRIRRNPLQIVRNSK